MFIKRIALDQKGQEISSYLLAVRTQMGEAFCDSRKTYADGRHFVDTLAIDWGVLMEIDDALIQEVSLQRRAAKRLTSLSV